MEMILFDTYRKLQEEKHSGVLKKIWSIPKKIIALFGMLFATMIGTIVILCDTNLHNYGLITICLEAIICVILYLYIEHYQISRTNIRLESYCRNCSELQELMVHEGVSNRAESFEGIKDRIEKRIEKAEAKREQTQEMIWHVIEIILFPLLIATFSSWIANMVELPQLLSALIVIILYIGIIGACIWVLYCIFSFNEKNQIEQMRNFSEDLQCIIDTQFKEVFLLKNDYSKEKEIANSNQKKTKYNKAENAGKPWSVEEDERLRKMHTSGCSVREMSKNFGRSRGSIESRLTRLGINKDKASRHF